MATAASPSQLERIRTKPLRGMTLAAVTAAVWIAGAAYCSGYEALLTGIDNWPASLWWSAVAVLPWLALFEWSKTPQGRYVAGRLPQLGWILLAVGAASLALEVGSNALTGSASAPVALLVLRRLPAIGVCLLLILWSRTGRGREDAPTDAGLAALASSIDWVAAADNYIELHIGGGVRMRRMTMQQAEQALAGRGFVRIHRRYLVNAARVAAVTGNGDKVAHLSDGTELPIGQRYGANLTLPR